MKKSIYTAEFRRELIRSFREQTESQTAFARKNGVSPKTFGSWLRADLESRPAHEQENLAKISALEKQVKRLRMERDILKKATVFFASESR